MFVADLFEVTLPQPPKKSQPDHMYVEAARPQLVAILPGRFQPWHLGHLDVFRSLQRKFGRDNAFVATSNVTSLPKSPFNFTDKTVFMTATGVPIDRIIEVTDPYKLPSQFDPAKTIFVVAVGAPDKQRLSVDGTRKDGSPTYFKTFESLDKCTTADKHGYVIIADEREKLITLRGTKVDVSHGTQTRETWNQIRNDPQARAEFLTQMYGRNDPEVARVLDKIPESTTVSEDAESDRVALLKKLYHTFNGADGVRRARMLLNKSMLRATAQEKKLLLSLTDENGTVLPVMGEHSSMPVANDSTSPIHGLEEEAAGVGVVSNSKDPRYVMATMGDQNDVNAGTLNKQMRAMGLLRKIRALKEQMQVLKRK